MLAIIATVAVIFTALTFVMAVLDQGPWNSNAFNNTFGLVAVVWFLSVIATAIETGDHWRDFT